MYQRESTTRIKLALIGAGSHAYRNLLPALHYLPVELVAVCDLNAELAATTARQYGNCRPFSDPRDLFSSGLAEAVLLAVGPAEHPRLACAAFDANLHVWTEKPVAFRAADVQDMIARRRDRVAVVGFKKLFMPAARKALDIIASPKYGGLKTILAVYPMDVPADGPTILDSRKFTNWLGNGVHPLSLLLAAGHASGGRAQSVTTLRGPRGGGAVFLTLTNGVSATFHLASGPQPIESYQFFADAWHLHIDNCLTVKLQRGYPFVYGRTDTYAPPGDDHGALVWEPQNCLATLENKALFTQGIVPELQHFCQAVLARRPATEGTLEFALELMRVYEAGILSTGQPVEIPQ